MTRHSANVLVHKSIKWVKFGVFIGRGLDKVLEREVVGVEVEFGKRDVVSGEG